MKRLEYGFDIFYLCTIFGLAAGTLWVGRGSAAGRLFAGMGFVLFVGDLFHLVPRVRALRVGRNNPRALGFGRLVTSVTATAYYLLLYRVWAACYPVARQYPWGWMVLGLGVVRIVLCLLPHNRWFSDKHAGLSWGLLRNIPFVALGVVVGGLFLIGQWYSPVEALRFVPLAVLISFACYLPPALFAGRVPALGALMMPKTLCYLWVQVMGLALLLA